MVAEAFLPNEENFTIINHKDGNPSNNNVENLEWCNQKLNAIHAVETGLQKSRPVKNLETGIIYRSLTHAVKECHVAEKTIKKYIGIKWEWI